MDDIWFACLNGKVEEVQRLLQNSQINSFPISASLSQTPFSIACGRGHFEIVDY